MKNCIKILRRLKKNESGVLVNNIQILGGIELVMAVLGKPHNLVKEGDWIYYWRDYEAKLWWKGFGVFELESDDHGVKWFVDHLVKQGQRYNEVVKYGVYGCKNDLEWGIIRQLCSPNRLIVYLDKIQLINYPGNGEPRQVHVFDFN